ncbi:MAG: PAS domain S-box protein [Pirellulales bacterium]|nr:PAS domain S-box protein [Pirellulales bacterium]
MTQGKDGQHDSRADRECPDARRYRYAPILAIVVAGLGFSVAAFAATRRQDAQRLDTDFGRAANNSATVVQKTIDAHVQMLAAARQVLAHSPRIDNDFFAKLAGALNPDRGLANWIAWAPRAPGGPDERFPIELIAPPDAAEGAIGLDLADYPIFRRTMAVAIAQKNVASTPRVLPPLGKKRSESVLTFLPVFDRGLAADPNASPSDAIAGFLVAELSPDKILDKALQLRAPQGLDMAIRDATAPEGARFLCYRASRIRGEGTSHNDPEPWPGAPTRDFWLTVGTRRWTLTAWPTEAFVAQRRTREPWVLLTGGLIVTTLLAGFGIARDNRLVALQRLTETRQREHMVRSILDSVQAGVVLIDPWTRRIADINRFAEGMLGARKDDLVGRYCFELICADRGANPMTSPHCRSRDAAECALRRPGRPSIPALKSAVPVTLDGHAYLLETLVDLTARKEAEEARREEEKKLQAISDCAIDALVMIDPAGCVTHWNPAAERMFGYAASEILGHEIHAVLATAKDYERHKLAFPAFAHTGQGPAIGRVTEMEAVHKNGSPLPIEISISSIQREGRWWAVAVIRDLTSRKEAERQLRRHARALEMANEALEVTCRNAQAANQAKGEFLANMSHELRTPLHGILSFASFGLRKGPQASVNSLLEYFQLIHDSGRALLSLVNDLLDLAKLESGKLVLDLTPLDLASLAVKTADEFRSRVSERHVTIECHTPSGGAHVVADAARMQQVVRNLLSNAIKFSSDGGVVGLTVSRRPGAVTVAVRDHGVGIPPEELGAVFDKFVQSSKTRTNAGGTGLGLAICREIVTAHRGRILAENAPEGGAVLMFTIPEDLRVETPIGASDLPSAAAPPSKPDASETLTMIPEPSVS